MGLPQHPKWVEEAQLFGSYLTLSQAALGTPYSTSYLRLRANQGKLKAVKHGSTWLTTRTWVDEYVQEYGSKGDDGSVRRTASVEHSAVSQPVPVIVAIPKAANVVPGHYTEPVAPEVVEKIEIIQAPERDLAAPLEQLSAPPELVSKPAALQGINWRDYLGWLQPALGVAATLVFVTFVIIRANDPGFVLAPVLRDVRRPVTWVGHKLTRAVAPYRPYLRPVELAYVRYVAPTVDSVTAQWRTTAELVRVAFVDESGAAVPVDAVAMLPLVSVSEYGELVPVQPLPQAATRMQALVTADTIVDPEARVLGATTAAKPPPAPRWPTKVSSFTVTGKLDAGSFKTSSLSATTGNFTSLKAKTIEVNAISSPQPLHFMNGFSAGIAPQTLSYGVGTGLLDTPALQVRGGASVQGDLTVRGNLELQGGLALKNVSELQVSGPSIFDDVDAARVNSSRVEAGTLFVNGHAFLQSGGVTGGFGVANFSARIASIGSKATDKFTVDATSTFNSPVTFSSPVTFTSTVTTNMVNAGQTVFSRVPTLPHTFGAWAPDVANSNVADAPAYINPASAAADTNLFGVAVAGSPKFLVDAEGDTFARSLGVDSNDTTLPALAVNAPNLSVTDSSTVNAATIDATVTGSEPGGNVYGQQITVGDASQGDGYNLIGQRISLVNSGGGGSVVSATGLSVDVSSVNSGTKYAAVLKGGNVGIGTVTPAADLHLFSDAWGVTARIESTADEAHLDILGSAGIAQINLRVDGASSGGYIEQSVDALAISNNGGQKYLLLNTGDGNVGIGQTSNPAYKLDVLKSVSGLTASDRVVNVSNAGTTFNTTAGALTSYGGYFSSTTTRSAGANSLSNVGLYVTASGAQNNYAAIFDQGNVGIGDITPSATLTVGNGDLFQVAGASGNITTSGDAAINGGDITTTSTTFNLVSATATTINFGAGATTALNIGGGSANVTLTDANWSITGPGLITTADDVAVNGGDITTTASTFNLVNATATTVNLAGGATAALNLGPGGATGTSVNLAGGSGATGCTVDGATGNFTCSGNITGSSSGTVGFWSRSGTTLSPATANDVLSITGNSGNIATITSSATGASNKALNISQTGATSGTDYGAFISNTGAATTNVGLYATASGGTSNYAGIFDQGNVGVGTTAPGRLLEVAGSASINNNLLAQLDGGLYYGRARVDENQWATAGFWSSSTARESNRSWTSITVSSDGRYVTAVVNGGQIYTSSDYGVTWTARDSSRLWQSVVMSSDGQYQTAGVNGGDVYTSSNYGVSWTARSIASNPYFAAAMSSDGRYQLAPRNGGQIYTSSDYGVTWTGRGSSLNYLGAAVSSDGKYQTVVAQSNQIYTSSDYGVTWTARDSSRLWQSAAMSSDGRYQTATVGTAGQLYTSSDYGVTWTARDSSRSWWGIAVSADGRNQTATTSNAQVYVSTDYGVTWAVKDSSRAWRAVAMSSGGKYQAAVVSGGQIYTSYSDSTTNGKVLIGATNGIDGNGSELEVVVNGSSGGIAANRLTSAETDGYVVIGPYDQSLGAGLGLVVTRSASNLSNLPNSSTMLYSDTALDIVDRNNNGIRFYQAGTQTASINTTGMLTAGWQERNGQGLLVYGGCEDCTLPITNFVTWGGQSVLYTEGENSGGRVGIGTTTPSADALLQIGDSSKIDPWIRVIGSADSGGQLILGDGAEPNIVTITSNTGGDPGIYFKNTSPRIGTVGTGGLMLTTGNNIDRITILSTGEVGIGTGAAGALLDVDTPNVSGGGTTESIQLRSASQTIALADGTTRTDQRQNQFIAPILNGVAGGGTETFTNAATVYIDAAPSGSNVTITNPYAFWVDAGTSRFDGNVGIGDSTPVALLTVGNLDLFQVASTGIVTFANTSPATAGTIDPTQTINSGTNDLVITGSDQLRLSGFAIDFWTSGSSKVAILNGGNVGINDTNPASIKLSVANASNQDGIKVSQASTALSTAGNALLKVSSATADTNDQLVLIEATSASANYGNSGSNSGILRIVNASTSTGGTTATNPNVAGAFIQTTDADTVTALIRNNNSSITMANVGTAGAQGDPGVLTIESNGGTTTNYNLITAFNSTTRSDAAAVFRVRADGGVYGEAAFNSSGADYAEYFFTSDTSLAPGEVVVLTSETTTQPGSINRSRQRGEPHLLGVVSTSPGFVGNNQTGFEGNQNYKLVALAGQVPVRVSTDNGAITAGDYLTSSPVPGVAMRASEAGRVIGRALQSFGANGEPRGTVLMLVEFGEYHPTAGEYLARLQLDVAEFAGLAGVDAAQLAPGDPMDVVLLSLHSLSQSVANLGQGAVVGTAASLKEGLQQLGLFVSDGVGKLTTLVAGLVQTDKLEVGTAEQPSGITLYDQVTHQPYCVAVNAGELMKTSGTCSTAAAPTPAPVPVSAPQQVEPQPASTPGATVPAGESATEPAPTEPAPQVAGAADQASQPADSTNVAP